MCLNNIFRQVICNEIYPSDLQIIRTNDSNIRSTFLDLDIFIEDRRFMTRLYDKRRDFSFNVVTFPNMKSNIPAAPAYGVFTGELYRLCKSSSDLADFAKEVKLLITKLVNQKFDKNNLYHKLANFLKARPACLSKYRANLNMSHFI